MGRNKLSKDEIAMLNAFQLRRPHGAQPLHFVRVTAAPATSSTWARTNDQTGRLSCGIFSISLVRTNQLISDHVWFAHDA